MLLRILSDAGAETLCCRTVGGEVVEIPALQLFGRFAEKVGKAVVCPECPAIRIEQPYALGRRAKDSHAQRLAGYAGFLHVNCHWRGSCLFRHSRHVPCGVAGVPLRTNELGEGRRNGECGNRTAVVNMNTRWRPAGGRGLPAEAGVRKRSGRGGRALPSAPRTAGVSRGSHPL